MRSFNPKSVPPAPISAELTEWLAENRAFDLEIGAGRGLHAIRYALGHPERTLVALERTENKFAAFDRRFRDHGSPANLWPARADAVSFVTHLVTTPRLARVFLLYPNPYPKARQANQRWHFAPFTARLRQAMVTGGELYLATNLAWYAEEAATHLPKFGFKFLRRRELKHAADARTHFERKYLSLGQTCFDLVFARD